MSYGGENEYGGSGIESDETGYGSRSEYGKPKKSHGSGYGRKSNDDDEPKSEYGSGYTRKSGYEKHDSNDESGKIRKNGSSDNDEKNSKYESKLWTKKDNSDEYGLSGYGKKSEGYGSSTIERPSYGRSEKEDYKKRSCGKRNDDDNSYGREKYVST
ncbi:hypothetical protein K7X08_017502 [Anisodus acutangulus]|uniref:Uncharacterized protein n=1 Tax=Anisodus acutangulus TaxID=402998 RepID=A0A9Q1R6E9_9SOLA|nr:hypothetical protein K7X08_017502 [Anisodus acutangulus]